MTTRSILLARKRTILAIGLLLIAAAIIVWYLQQNPVRGWDFNNNIWIPARLLVDGQSPYRVDLLHETGNAVWMPAIIGISAPLGWLSFYTASNLWFLVNLASLSAIIGLLAVRQRPSVALVAIAAAMAAAFPPAITHLKLGQIAILATFLFLAVAYLKERLPLPIAALMLALAFSKPQLGLLAVPGLLILYFREDGRGKALQLLVLIVLWSVALAAPLFLGSTSWISDFIAALLKNPSWVHPSMWVLLPKQLGPVGLWLWIVIALALGVIALRLWFTQERETAILWSLALTPLLTPYIWSWDFVMVLPLFASTVMAAKSRLQLAVLGLGYLLCWLMIWQIATSDPNNFRYWWIPWYIIALVLVASFAGKLAERRIVAEKLKPRLDDYQRGGES